MLIINNFCNRDISAVIKKTADAHMTKDSVMIFPLCLSGVNRNIRERQTALELVIRC